MKKVAALLPLAAFLALASCATTKGSLFKQVLSSAPSAGSSSVEVQPSETKPEQTGLDVQTTPSDAQVYLGDTFIGDTPLIYSGFKPGTYKITISKRGYYDSVRWLSLDPTAYTLLQTELMPKTGTLSIGATPPAADISVDGLSLQAGAHQIPVGLHQVKVRAFGYEDWERSVDIRENQTTVLRAVLTKAPFRVSALSASRTVLDPYNPGALGQVVFSFEVSTYGSGSVAVVNRSGRTVFLHDFERFAKRDQSVAWNGRASDGAPLPNGTYRVTVSGKGENRAQQSRQSVEVRIDQGALIGMRSMLSGISGLLFAGTPEVLPVSSYSVASLLLAHVESAGALIPVQASFRAVPHAGIELDGQASVQLESTTSVPFSVGLGGKFVLIRPRGRNGFSASVTVGGTYQSGTTSDTLTNFTGLSVGMPVEYRLGIVALVLMPEVIAAPYPASYTSSSVAFAPTVWGYGRGGILLDWGPVATGVSFALRTAPFTQGLQLASVPLAAGWEIHWLIPHTQLVASGAIAGEYSPTAGYYVMAGAGLGFIN